MNQAGITTADRKTVAAALNKAEATGEPAAAIEFPDGVIVTGKTSELLGASSAMLINALKRLAGIPDDTLLISPNVIEPIQKLKTEHLGNQNPRLHTDEVLIALSICAVTNPVVQSAMQQLHNLAGCEVHSSVILSHIDENVFKKLGINLTCEPKYQENKFYQK